MFVPESTEGIEEGQVTAMDSTKESSSSKQ